MKKIWELISCTLRWNFLALCHSYLTQVGCVKTECSLTKLLHIKINPLDTIPVPSHLLVKLMRIYPGQKNFLGAIAKQFEIQFDQLVLQFIQKMRRNTPAMVLVHSARLQKQLFPIRIPKNHGICYMLLRGIQIC